MTRPARAALLLAVFGVVFVTHDRSPVTMSCDSMFSIHTAMSILREGNTDLDEYEPVLEKQGRYNILTYHGHQYSRYCIGVPLMALPFVAVRDAHDRLMHGQSFEARLQKDTVPRFEKTLASIFIALAAVFVFLIAERRLTVTSDSPSTGKRFRLRIRRETALALVVALVFAFGTSAWSTGSRALWQHGPSMLIFSVVLNLFVRGEDRPGWVPVSGALLAFSYVVRPTNLLPAAVLAVFVLYRHRRQFLPMLAWAAPVIAAFLIYNYNLFGSAVSEYYSPASHRGSGHYFEALAGHLISPARGLFVYSPVFLLIFAGVAFRIGQRKLSALDGTVLVLLVLHLVMVSFGARWWAGHCFGPRYLSDVTPFFVWFLIPVVDRFRWPFTRGTAALAATFVLLAAASFYINRQGAVNGHCMWWNARPIAVENRLDRLWDWTDLPFLRRSTPDAAPPPEAPAKPTGAATN